MRLCIFPVLSAGPVDSNIGEPWGARELDDRQKSRACLLEPKVAVDIATDRSVRADNVLDFLLDEEVV